jgi:hypothetical protein
MAMSGAANPDGQAGERPSYLRDDGLFAYERISGLEARAGWALGPGLPAFLPPDTDPDEVLIPFLVELADEDAVKATVAFVDAVFNQIKRAASDLPGVQTLVQLPDGVRSLAAGEIYSMALRPQDFFELATPETNAVFAAFRAASKRIELGLPMRGVTRS